MNSKSDHEPETRAQSATHDLLTLESLCSDFERNWTTRSVSTIADLVLQADAHLQSSLAAELVTTDMEIRHARNEHLDTDEYLTRLPGFSQDLEEAISDCQVLLAESAEGLEADPKRIGDYRIVRLLEREAWERSMKAFRKALEEESPSRR